MLTSIYTLFLTSIVYQIKKISFHILEWFYFCFFSPQLSVSVAFSLGATYIKVLYSYLQYWNVKCTIQTSMFEHILRKYNFCGNKAKFTHVIILTIDNNVFLVMIFSRMYAMEGSRRKSHFSYSYTGGHHP